MQTERKSALKNRIQGAGSQGYEIEKLKRTQNDASETVQRLRESERVRPERLREPVTV